MTRTFSIAALLAATVSFSTPVFAQDSDATVDQDSDVTVDTVVARVGEAEITMGHVLVMRGQLPDRVLQLEDEVLFKGIVDQLIDQYLLGQSLDESALASTIALQMENELRGARASAALQTVLDAAVTDEALQTAYDAQFAETEPPTEYNASHILLETEEDAQEVVELLEDGADFAELAMEKSTGPSAPRGGDLGWFRDGQMIPVFYEATTALEIDEVSAPVQSEYGWHVIVLKDTREATPPSLEEVSSVLAQELQQTAVEARVSELRDAAELETFVDDIDPAQMRNDALLAN